MRKHIKRFDETMTKKLVSFFGPRFRPFFLVQTTIGDPLFVSFVAVGLGVVGITIESEWLVPAALAVPATLFIGAILKVLFERTRPVTEYAMKMRFHTYSFPSGHSSGSVVAFGALSVAAYSMIVHPLGLIVSICIGVIPFFVGVSRVYLGAHFPSDVIAGWALGLVILLPSLIIGGALS